MIKICVWVFLLTQVTACSVMDGIAKGSFTSAAEIYAVRLKVSDFLYTTYPLCFCDQFD